MWRNALRDLQWRKRRYAIAVVGASFVFAMTLVASGLSASFRAEAARTQAAIGADAWVVRQGTPGPFTSFELHPGSLVTQMAAEAGVERADGMVIVRQTASRPRLVDVALYGHTPGGIGTPPVSEGRAPAETGEAAVDASLGVRPSETIEVGGRRFTVTGLTQGLTSFAGLSNVYVPLRDVQQYLLRGQTFVTALPIRGRPAEVPAGYRILSDPAVLADAMRPMQKAISALDILQLLLWIVAAAIIGSVVYLSALERVRDFAVFKATGESTTSLLAGVVMQAVILAFAAAVLACGVAAILVPVFPVQADVPPRAYPLLFGMAVVVGAVASGFGIRRTVSVEPALAFGGP
jgi:putative ABC transport system permease protein